MKEIKNALYSYFDQTRRFCIAFSGGATIGVRGLVINAEQQVLLLKHTYRGGWHTPGGGVGPRETPIEALRRELREEVGIEVRGSPEVLQVYTQMFRGVTDYPIFFLVTEFDGNGHAADSREIAEVKWFDWQEACQQATPKTKKFLKEFENKRGFRERW